MRKRKWMKAGACALSAVLIMGLYAGPAFAEWIGTGGARAYIINGQVQNRLAADRWKMVLPE